MFDTVLPVATKKLLEKLTQRDLPVGSYLAGGTAVALQTGHRQSVDLDFFVPNQFEEIQWEQKLSSQFTFHIIQSDIQTLVGMIDGVKVSIFGYRYPLLSELLSYVNLQIASLSDLAAMKLDTLTRRGTKRDFIDLYFLIQKFGLKKIFSLYDQKFRNLNEKEVMLRKALVFFDDAEGDEMPKMIVDVSWEEVKVFLTEQVTQLESL